MHRRCKIILHDNPIRSFISYDESGVKWSDVAEYMVDSVKLFYTIGAYKLNPKLNKFIYPKIFNYFFDSKIYKNLVIEKRKIIKNKEDHIITVFFYWLFWVHHIKFFGT
jgi:hypothetical protein